MLRWITRKHVQVRINRIDQMRSIVDLSAYDEIADELDDTA